LLPGHAEQAQEPVQDCRRVGRRLRRIEAAEVDEQHPLERLLLVQQVPGVDGELGLADPGHPLDRGDHHRLPALCRVAEPVEFAGAAGEPGQILRQAVLHPDLRHRLDLPAHDPQRLAPLRHVPDVGMQRLDHREHQVVIQPAPAGPETIGDGGLTHQLAGRPTGSGPSPVDPVLDRLVGGVAGPDLQPAQPLDKIDEAAGPCGIGRPRERVPRARQFPRHRHRPLP
jgi:hypothetical protein